MAFRFWRRIRLAPGVTLNLSKSMASLSIGPQGAKYTISPRGNRATAGITGTGLFYTVHDRKRAGRGGAAPAPEVAEQDRLTLGFFQRLFTPAEEKRFVDGIRAVNEGDQDAALAALEEARDMPDAAWMAGHLRAGFPRCAARAFARGAGRGRADRGGGMIGPVYVVSDPDAPIPVSEQARAAARGGAWAVQLRDKTAPESKMARMAAALLEDLGPLGVRVFVNDRLEVARQTGADLHIGQGDGDPRAARDRIGPDAILGLSIETAAQCAALPDGVDYIGAGPGRSGPPRRNPTLRHPSACRGSSGSCRPARCLLSPLAG